MTCPACDCEIVEYEWGRDIGCDYGRASRIARGRPLPPVTCPECGHVTYDELPERDEDQ